jgi:Cu/Zn superoxide dismutase
MDFPKKDFQLLRSILQIFAEKSPDRQPLSTTFALCHCLYNPFCQEARKHEIPYRVALGMFLALIALPSRSAAKITVELKDAQGKSVGDVVIWDQGPGVALSLDLHDLTPGEHAVHFH